MAHRDISSPSDSLLRVRGRVWRPNFVSASVLLVSVMLGSLGCDQDPLSPSAPDQMATFGTASATAEVLSFRQISTSVNHSCGVTTDDRAYCWGSNSGGTLGIGSTKPVDDYSTRPVAVVGGLRFRLVSVGTYHSCGLTVDDRAYCWGQNRVAELGDGTRTNRLRPVEVAGGRRYRQLRAGGLHTCAVTTSDVAFCWGDNGWGQLGDGTTHGPLRPVRVAGGVNFRRIFAGGNHTCASTPGGRTYCWGDNTYGQLGDGTRSQRLQPVRVLGGLLFNQLSTGKLHSCAVADGRAYCWGRNRYGSLGDGTVTPQQQPVAVAGSLRFAGVSAGNDYTCGVTMGKQAYCWGSNHSGKLGDGTANTVRLTPVAVTGGLSFANVNAGVVGSTTCGVTTGARGYCWGDNWNGEVGDGTYGNSRLTAVPVAAPM